MTSNSCDERKIKNETRKQLEKEGHYFKTNDESANVKLSNEAYDLFQHDKKTFGYTSSSQFLRDIIKAEIDVSCVSVKTRELERREILNKKYNYLEPSRRKELVEEEIVKYNEKLNQHVGQLLRKKGTHKHIKVYFEKDSTDQSEIEFFNEFGIYYKNPLDKPMKIDGITINANFVLGKYCIEQEVYHRNLNKYFKAIVEEFFLKNYYEREKIIKKDIFNKLEHHIKNNTIRLSIKYNNESDKIIITRPYKIVYDRFTLYSYLVGMRCEKDKAPYPVSLQISKISRVEPRVTRNGEIREKQVTNKQFDQWLKERGAQYFGHEAIDIEVELTEYGKIIYRNALYMKPLIEKQSKSKDNKDIYHFKCTEEQAFHYFKKFGKDAKIIKPQELKDRLANFYLKACHKNT